jgi:hypothetical protein
MSYFSCLSHSWKLLGGDHASTGTLYWMSDFAALYWMSDFAAHINFITPYDDLTQLVPACVLSCRERN